MMENPLAADLNHIFEHTSNLWEELRGKRLFITGGTGFFGAWLLESFTWINDRQNLGASMVVLSRDPAAFERKAPHLAHHPMIELIQGDVRSFDFPAGEFSHIIHSATDVHSGLNPAKPLDLLDTILNGTRRVLDFSRFCHAEKFLLVSSGAVYGKQPADLMRISEDYPGAPDPLDPGSVYGQGKRIAEHLCVLSSSSSKCTAEDASHHTDLQIKIARCFSFVGPYQSLDSSFAVCNFIRDGLMGHEIKVQGNGTPQRSYLYAADLAIWLWKILFRGNPMQPYNVGSENSISIADLSRRVANLMGCQSVILNNQAVDPQKKPERYIPSTKKVRDELGLQQWIELDHALKKTITWHSMFHNNGSGDFVT